MKNISINVQGRVQGVFFRASTKQKAEELGISGWVKNKKDKSVSIEAEGKEEALKQLLAWCRQGPHQALVKKVNYKFNKNIKNLKDFQIKY